MPPFTICPRASELGDQQGGQLCEGRGLAVLRPRRLGSADPPAEPCRASGEENGEGAEEQGARLRKAGQRGAMPLAVWHRQLDDGEYEEGGRGRRGSIEGQVLCMMLVKQHGISATGSRAIRGWS